MSGLKIKLGNQEITLKDRYFLVENTLVLADLHLGKTMHFRKAGMAIPPSARDADQRQLMQLLTCERPARLLVLGDLFHSASNSECEELAMITSQFPEVEFELVLGNHDILEPEIYRSLDFETSTQATIGNLIFTHEPLAELRPETVNIHGHIHPGIRLRGKARQSVLVPCFHLANNRLCLPAFGLLTGLMPQKPKKGDAVFGVLEGDVNRVF